MTGGYLTIDLSDVKVEGALPINTPIANKKGLHNYLLKTKKPVFFIFSDNLVNAIAKYIGIVGYDCPNNNVLIKPILFDKENQPKNTLNVGLRFDENGTLGSYGLFLQVLENDDIVFTEI